MTNSLLLTMVFNPTFNNISAISWRSILFVEETEAPEENHRPVASHWQTLSLNVAPSTPRLSGIRTNNFCGDRPNKITFISSIFVFPVSLLVVIGTDCKGSYKSNYHIITTTTAPFTLSYLQTFHSEIHNLNIIMFFLYFIFVYYIHRANNLTSKHNRWQIKKKLKIRTKTQKRMYYVSILNIFQFIYKLHLPITSALTPHNLNKGAADFWYTLIPFFFPLLGLIITRRRFGRPVINKNML